MMKSASLLFIFSMFFYSISGLASPALGEEKSSPQYYQQAEEPASSLYQNKPTVDQKAVQSSRKHANHSAQQAGKEAAPASAIASQALVVLQAEVSQINQNNVMFQQKTSDRFSDLNSRYEQLSQQLNQLHQAVTLLNQEIAQLNPVSRNQSFEQVQVSPQQKSLLEEAAQVFDSPLFKWVLAGGFLVVLLLAWAFWPKEEDTASAQSDASDASFDTDEEADDTQDEYDYMGSVESVPAKLDLARTYLAMEDYRAAKAVLQDVMKQGTSEQCAQAKKLLDQIPS